MENINQLPETFKMCELPEEMLTHKVVNMLSKKPSKLLIKALEEGYVIEEEFFNSDNYLEESLISENTAHLGKELVKHKLWFKKRKHIKDNRRDTWWDTHRHGDRHSENREYRHLRAQKVFTTNEYLSTPDDENTYLEYLYNFNTSGYDEYFNDWWNEDPWFYDEMGYGGLINDDWKDYVDHTGRVLPYIPCNGNCEKGYCMSCDWDYSMKGLSWADDDFVEWWDYGDYWVENVKKRGRKTILTSREHKERLSKFGELLAKELCKEHLVVDTRGIDFKVVEDEAAELTKFFNQFK